MKTKLVFEMNDDKEGFNFDEQKLNRLLRSDNAYNVLYELRQYAINGYKNSSDGKEITFYENLGDVIETLLYDNGIILDKDYS